jgi:hypothetical protein
MSTFCPTTVLLRNSPMAPVPCLATADALAFGVSGAHSWTTAVTPRTSPDAKLQEKSEEVMRKCIEKFVGGKQVILACNACGNCSRSDCIWSAEPLTVFPPHCPRLLFTWLLFDFHFSRFSLIMRLVVSTCDCLKVNLHS